MWSSKPLAALALGAALLSACAEQAGAPLGRGAVAPESARIDALAAAFRADVDPVVNFAFDSAALGAEARARLARQAGWLRANPEAAVKVTGHADLVGPSGYNQRLGRLRAAAVAARLAALGVAPERVSGVVSRGERDPLIPVAARRRANRRVVIEVAWLGAAPEGLGMDGVRAQEVYDAYQNLQLDPPTVEGNTVQ